MNFPKWYEQKFVILYGVAGKEKRKGLKIQVKKLKGIFKISYERFNLEICTDKVISHHYHL